MTDAYIYDAIPTPRGKGRRDGALHEIKSADILQPGPAALTDGLQRMHDIIAAWARR